MDPAIYMFFSWKRVLRSSKDPSVIYLEFGIYLNEPRCKIRVTIKKLIFPLHDDNSGIENSILKRSF